MAEELKRRKWEEANLVKRRKGDPEKVKMALRLRREAYRTGYGVPKSKDIAMSWYHSAATNNQPHSCFLLALGYLEEKTNQEAQIEAYRYMLQAAQAGQ